MVNTPEEVYPEFLIAEKKRKESLHAKLTQEINSGLVSCYNSGSMVLLNPVSDLGTAENPSDLLVSILNEFIAVGWHFQLTGFHSLTMLSLKFWPNQKESAPESGTFLMKGSSK